MAYNDDKPFTNRDIEQNKFYVGTNRVLANKWGHPTLEKAIAHAKRVINGEDNGHGGPHQEEVVFVVKIVKVVRRAPAPVTVKDVK